MATAESIEGAAGTFWFHYDISNDVLYLRLITAREEESHGEEDESGFILLRAVSDDRLIGMTVVDWWKRFGSGSLPDSVREIVARIEPWAKRAQTAA